MPLVAVVHDTTGGFAWLFVIYAALALVIAATALLLLPGEPGKAVWPQEADVARPASHA